MAELGKPAARLFLWKQQHGRCGYCKRMMILDKPWDSMRRATIDHINPRARFGSDKLNNLILACRNCNEAKADMSREDFQILLAALQMGEQYASV